MTTHVLIVDINTFPLHLNYLFVGTGAKEHVIDFNNSGDSSLHPQAEIMLADMIADGGRMRSGDNIIFYLQQNANIPEGKFFGIFEAITDGVFLDNNDDDQFLKKELGKSLTFRALISPFNVYAEGVTEWEALDEIRNINAPNQMLWSLIYRKLKGNRGNTMITMYESERLTQLIRNKNNRRPLDCSGKGLSFDIDSQRIIVLDNNGRSYTGRQERIDLLPRLVEKHARGLSFEAHLQTYITQNIGLGINPNLDAVILEQSKVEWLGNEVSCGVGMQRIDIMVSAEREQNKVVMPIELKSVEANESNIRQIQRYIDWVQQYYIPNLPSDIQPILLTKKINDKTTDLYQNLIQSFNQFNNENSNSCEPLRFIEFSIDRNNVLFKSVDYL